MENRLKPPISLNDIKAKLTKVSVTHEPKDEADIAATQLLLQIYTQDDGFHCPRCGVVITKPEEAVYHLAEEINKTLDALGKQPI